MLDPNFPPELSINPSSSPFSTDNHPHQDYTKGSRSAFNFAAQQSAIQKYGIAGRVWEASYTLTRYLQNHENFDPPSPFSFPAVDAATLSETSPFCILELGSGTGIVAAHLATLLSTQRAVDNHRNRVMKTALRHIIIATDMENVCPLLKSNLQVAPPGGSPRESNDPEVEVVVRPLTWGNKDHIQAISNELSERKRKLTHIICSDLVYFPELLPTLLRSLIQLTSSPPNLYGEPTIIIAYKIRSLPKESPFWTAFGLWFDWEPVLYCAPSTTQESPPPWSRYHAPSSTYLFTARRKPGSYLWHVPQNDTDLLEGVGANGNELKKADERFEVMLLMDMFNSDDGR